MEPSTVQYDLSVADGSQFDGRFLRADSLHKVMESYSGGVIKPDDV